SITIKNKCKDSIGVGVLTNGKSQSGPEQSFDLSPGSSQTISKSDKWGGRIWGRHGCEGESSGKCGTPGTGNPASLAEFFFKGSGDHDYYDISLVDGYNLPMTITPGGGGGSGDSSGKYKCGSPSCDVPKCPEEYAIVDKNGKVTGCQSSCSKHDTDETCCKGDHDDPEVCRPDKQSKSVKEACPDAYSFAYDDQTSTFNCQEQSYEVSFC
ncbi:thaumatin, partial [Zychaea mexicana]|uniref:thaumatin n=1 Tax=Zychaea mexicana TaxID=64656 RepID=UPI0022FDB68F